MLLVSPQPKICPDLVYKDHFLGGFSSLVLRLTPNLSLNSIICLSVPIILYTILSLLFWSGACKLSKLDQIKGKLINSANQFLWIGKKIPKFDFFLKIRFLGNLAFLVYLDYQAICGGVGFASLFVLVHAFLIAEKGTEFQVENSGSEKMTEIGGSGGVEGDEQVKLISSGDEMTPEKGIYIQGEVDQPEIGDFGKGLKKGKDEDFDPEDLTI